MSSLTFRFRFSCPFDSNDTLQTRSKKILLSLLLVAPLLGLFIWIGQTHVENTITVMHDNGNVSLETTAIENITMVWKWYILYTNCSYKERKSQSEASSIISKNFISFCSLTVPIIGKSHKKKNKGGIWSWRYSSKMVWTMERKKHGTKKYRLYINCSHYRNN